MACTSGLCQQRRVSGVVRSGLTLRCGRVARRIRRHTHAAKAVCDIEGERRWVLTGTPLSNSLEDIYPLVCPVPCHV
jgi:hypothetical protein